MVNELYTHGGYCVPEWDLVLNGGVVGIFTIYRGRYRYVFMFSKMEPVD